MINEENEDSEENSFLNEMNNNNYVNTIIDKKQERLLKKQNDEIEKQKKRDLKIQQREEKKYELELRKIGKNQEFDSENLQGKDKLILIHKINQYKLLFPNELKTFKFKEKNASIAELQSYVKECSDIIEINSVDQFMLDSIISSIKMVEPFTEYSDYNISGLSVILKQNPDFVRLSKLLFIKYQVFSQIPVEIQMISIVCCTSYLCIQKNKTNHTINAYLDEEI